MSHTAQLRIAWIVATAGCLIRLFGDLYGSSGERTAGNLTALFGFVAVLILMLVSKIGNYKPTSQTSEGSQTH
jgi:hypothetical protein